MTVAHPEPQIRDDEQLRVVENTDLDRYELWLGRQFIGFEGYERHDDGSPGLELPPAQTVRERRRRRAPRRSR